MSLDVKKILVPVDFSETSNLAFEYALTLARVFGAEVLAFHVLEEPIVYAPTTAQSFRDAYEQPLREKLAALPSQPGTEGLTVTTDLKHGPPFLEIIQKARDEHADLIVMGTHGHGPIGHLLMGSVAENVVRSAHCPVLTVRPGGKQITS